LEEHHQETHETASLKLHHSIDIQDEHHLDEHHKELTHEGQSKNIVTNLKNRYLKFEHNLIQRSEKKKENQYRSQLELMTAIDEHCDSVLHTYSSFRLFLLAIMGGIYLSLGVLFATLISADYTTKSAQKFMVGVGFIGSFAMIIFSKSVLYTEVNISVAVHLMKSDLVGIIRRSIYYVITAITTCFKNHMHIQIRRPHKSISLMTILNSLKLWGISIIGNILGTVLMSAILGASLVFYDNAGTVQSLCATTKHKIDIFMERGTSGWFLCLLSGTVANFMIGTATLLSQAAVTIPGKILGLSFPILAFASLGVQHSPANVAYFSHTFLWRDMFAATTNLTMTHEMQFIQEFPWWESIIWNLIPAAIGNAVGGFFLAAVLVFIFVKG